MKNSSNQQTVAHTDDSPHRFLRTSKSDPFIVGQRCEKSCFHPGRRWSVVTTTQRSMSIKPKRLSPRHRNLIIKSWNKTNKLKEKCHSGRRTQVRTLANVHRYTHRSY
uniref:Uncharacterized protein n=1 Tax=Parascaris univalens TaxID=6257 RepID=A0A915AX01_PARUN